MKLGFGYNAGLPEGVKAAWGCRLIVDMTGYTDYLANRTGRFGEDADLDALFAWIDSGAMESARLEASRLLRASVMHTRREGHFVLFEDETGVIVGNTNASAGYLYVAAWLKAHAATEATA